jgi:serine/threonine-protein kinase
MRTPLGKVLGPAIVYPPLLAFPIFTAFVLLAYGVLDIRMAAQRALHYVLTRWFISWGTSLPIVLLAGVIYVNRSQSVALVLATPQARLLVWMSIAGALLLAFRGTLLNLADRLMLRGLADPSVTLAKVGRDLRTGRTLMELATVVAGAAERTLQADTDVYMVEEGNILASALPGGAHRRDHSLVPVLVQGAGGPCMVDPQGQDSNYNFLSPDDRAWIHREDIMAACPIVIDRDGRVRALMTIKKRRSALRLSQADMQFLSAACSAATLAYAGLAQPESAAALEELGLLCSQCARVEEWRSDPGRCACGGAWKRAALPKVVRGYLQLDALLGTGGMGVVYRATDLTLGRTVAVKTLPQLSSLAAERLLQEARSMAALSHPHIAVLYAAELWRGTPILVVELLEGGTLASRLRECRPSAEAALRTVANLAGTLDYMHTQGRCHGDIKPSNVGFTAGDVPKFLDFGLSRSLHADADDTRLIGGTLAYLSPDVLGGDAPGPAADVWALSVVLFEAVAGYHPFLHATDTVTRIKAGLDTHIEPAGSVPQAIVDLLHNLLSPRAHDRPATARDLLTRLNSVRTA